LYSHDHYILASSLKRNRKKEKMSASANAGNDASVPCATPNCGFWGRPSTGNFCSRCYKEKMNEKPSDKLKQNKTEEKKLKETVEKDAKEIIEEKTPAEKCEKEAPTPDTCKKDDLKAKTAEGDDDKGRKKRKQKNRMRCFECRKKVGLTGIECSCGFVFCGVHRYPNNHNCDFDFKADARARFLATATNKAAVVDKIVGEKL